MTISSGEFKRRRDSAYTWMLNHALSLANIANLKQSMRDYCGVCRGALRKMKYRDGDWMECRKCGREYDMTPPPLPEESPIIQPEPQIILTDTE